MTKQLAFIASGGRTGTQFFGDMLSRVVSDCHSVHEPDMVAGLSRQTLARIRRFGVWHMGPGRLLGRTGVRLQGQALLEGRIGVETCRHRLRAMRARYHAGLPESLVVESYYAWWMVAGRIDDIWPGARLAGILRDPRDWIASWLRHAPSRRRGALSERLPPGPPHPARMGDPSAAALWPRLDQVGRLAWEWELIRRTLSDAAADNPNVRIFRFEDVFGPDRGAMHEVARFVSDFPFGPAHRIGDLDAIAGDVRNASSGRVRGTGGTWQSWSDAQVAAIEQFCGPGMRALGYGAEPDWQERVARSGTIFHGT